MTTLSAAPQPGRSFRLGAAAFDVLVFTYALTVPLEEVSIPGLGRLPALVGLLLGGVVALRIMADVRTLRLHLPWLTLTLLYLGVVLASEWWTVDTGITATRIGTLVNLVAIALIIVGAGSRRTLVAGVLGLASGGAVLGAANLTSYSANVNADADAAEVRVTAYDLDPNDAAAMIVVAAVGVLSIGLATRRRVLSWPMFALAGFLAASAVLTSSRTGMLALLAGAAVVMWQARHRVSHVLVLAGLAPALAWVVVTSVDPRITERLAGTGEAVASGDFNLRQYLWTAAVDAWSRRPLLGWGAGTERVAVEEFSSYSMVSHNTWLAVLVETGILGLTLFVCLWLLALPRRATPRFERTVVWGLLVPLLVATFSLSLEYRKITWLVLTLCVLAATQREARPTAQPPGPALARPLPGAGRGGGDPVVAGPDRRAQGLPSSAGP